MAESKQTASESSQKKERTFKVPSRLIEVQKRILDGQRSLFDTSYNAMSAWREGQENALHTWLEQSTVVPKPWKQIAEAWTESSKQARDNYRETVDRSFSLLEEWVDGLAAKNEG